MKVLDSGPSSTNSLTSGLLDCLLANTWVIISLNTTMFDHQKVNLQIRGGG
ncbi:hypothetical protein Hanom_Chr05g00389711 [Helianthus anomalus]